MNVFLMLLALICGPMLIQCLRDVGSPVRRR